MINWKFPSNDNGEVIGLNNAGIETFLGEPITSLAREINQNSLDAPDVKSGRPVEVHFTVEQVPSELFPGRENFLEILDSCLNFWTENKKAKAFFERAKATLSADTITVLKISDFFTTGLTGSDQTKGSNWINLTKASGASDKLSGAGGSFGIGKHAPYACTGLRTVFYNTKDIDGKTAFQGVAKLVTHLDKEGLETQGTGYFGLSQAKSPIKNLEQIPEFFHRSTVGTDVVVFGFDGGQDWEAKIIRSVLENFFVAIHQRKLIVAVGKTRLDDTTLPELIQQYFGSDSESECAKYYQAFTSDDAKFFSLEDFEGLGGVELHVLPGQHFPKRVAMVRQTGMLVFYKGHFQTPMKFAGVMRATGDGINGLLRSLEPPSHTKWETERHEDPAYAKKIVKRLYDWVRECVKQTSQEGAEEEYDFEGMQQYLPDDLEDEPDKSSKVDGEKSAPKEIELVIRESKKAKQPGEHEASKSSDGESDDATKTSDEDTSNSQDSPDSAQPGNSGDGGTDQGDGSMNKDSDGQGAPTRTPVAFRKLRAFCSDPTAGEYRVIFQPTKQIEGFLQLRVVGEVEESIAPAISATCGGNPIPIRSDGLIGPIMFEDNSNQEISVVLANRLHCALEVAGYENQ